MTVISDTDEVGVLLADAALHMQEQTRPFLPVSWKSTCSLIVHYLLLIVAAAQVLSVLPKVEISGCHFH